MGKNGNEGNQGVQEYELTIEYLEEAFKKSNIRVDNEQIRGLYQFLGGNENEGNEDNESFETLEEGFESMGIMIDGSVENNQILSRILKLLRDNNIQGFKRVRQFMEQNYPHMSILTNEFVDDLEADVGS